MTGKEESPFVDYMIKNNIPLTRKDYMSLALPDVPESEIGAELESEIPEMFKNNEESLKSKVRIVKKT
jgi:hypothetical protein